MSRRPYLRTCAAAAGAAALLGAFTGCSTNSQAAPAIPRTSPPTTTQSPTATRSPTTTATTPSPTATATTPSEQAIAQAQDAVRRYYSVMDQIERDPTVDQTRAKEVTISTGLVDAYTEINFLRSRGWRSTGEPLRIVSMDSKVVTLVFKPHQQPPVVPEVKVAVCFDVSKSGAIDASGKSVVPADRKARGVERFTVANYSWPDPQGWKVVHDEAKAESCPDPSA